MQNQKAVQGGVVVGKEEPAPTKRRGTTSNRELTLGIAFLLSPFYLMVLLDWLYKAFWK